MTNLPWAEKNQKKSQVKKGSSEQGYVKTQLSDLVGPSGF